MYIRRKLLRQGYFLEPISSEILFTPVFFIISINSLFILDTMLGPLKTIPV